MRILSPSHGLREQLVVALAPQWATVTAVSAMSELSDLVKVPRYAKQLTGENEADSDRVLTMP